MTGRERMRVAMGGGRPDRTPVMCQLALGHYFRHAGRDPFEVWHDTEAFAEALVALQRRYVFDGILVNLPGRDPAWRRHVRRTARDGGRLSVTWEGGMTTVVPPDDNPYVVGTDGRAATFSLEDVDPDRLWYVEPHDPGGVTYPLRWDFSDTEAPRGAFPPWHFDGVRRVRDRVGDAASVHGEVFSPLSQLVSLLGLEPAMLALATDAPRAHACLSALAVGAAAKGIGLLDAGADAVLVSSAFAGAGFLSRRHYREFVLPYEREVVAGIHAAADAFVYTHTCGAIGDRLDLMEETGTAGIDTLDPPPLGDVDLATARRWAGGRLFLKGNVDPVNVVLRGGPDDVRQAARACLEAAAPAGGYVLSTACSVPPAAPPVNVATLREARDAYEEGLNRMSPGRIATARCSRAAR